MHDHHSNTTPCARTRARSFRMRLTLILFLPFLLLASNKECEAGFLPGFVGNTKGDTDPNNARWTVNFAVLDRLTGPSSPGDVFGRGLAGFDDLWLAGGGSETFDTTARYLYLYQFVESPTTTSNWFLVYAGIESDPMPPITSYQQWSLFLADGAGNVSTTNDFGIDGVGFSTNPPANIGVANPHVSASGDTDSLITTTFILTPTYFVGIFDSHIHPGEMSGLWGVTSNAPPVFYLAPLSEFQAGATVPIPSPEPSTSILLALGGLAIVIHQFRARRSNR